VGVVDASHVDAVAVVDAERGVPLGILTLRDVLIEGRRLLLLDALSVGEARAAIASGCRL